MTKFGDTTVRVSLSKGAIKIQTFSPLTLDARNFQDRQVRRKTKMKRSFSNKNTKIQLEPFSARLMKFLE